MITNFEELTAELTADEVKLIPVLVNAFKKRGKDRPIKEPEITFAINKMKDQLGLEKPLTGVRLRKLVHYIRETQMIPLMATSKGYFVSYAHDDIVKQVQSLRERAASINKCADGMETFLYRSEGGHSLSSF